MKSAAIIAVVTLGLSACTTALTQHGAAVQPVTENQKEKYCQFIAIVTGKESMGMSRAGDAKSAMNKVRNEVAKAGGNAMRIISTTTDDARQPLSLQRHCAAQGFQPSLDVRS